MSEEDESGDSGDYFDRSHAATVGYSYVGGGAIDYEEEGYANDDDHQRVQAYYDEPEPIPEASVGRGRLPHLGSFPTAAAGKHLYFADGVLVKDETGRQIDFFNNVPPSPGIVRLIAAGVCTAPSSDTDCNDSTTHSDSSAMPQSDECLAVLIERGDCSGWDAMQLIYDHRNDPSLAHVIKDAICTLWTGLQTIHARGWIHGDVKSPNFIVTPQFDASGNLIALNPRFIDMEHSVRVSPNGSCIVGPCPPGTDGCVPSWWLRGAGSTTLSSARTAFLLDWHGFYTIILGMLFPAEVAELPFPQVDLSDFRRVIAASTPVVPLTPALDSLLAFPGDFSHTCHIVGFQNVLAAWLQEHEVTKAH